ncbi:PTS system mannose/fructose/sorbose family transporter subunit IID [Candidatus Endomicrobiellum trichonymphae]|uniref:PTS mannose/fructose/N-acetylgalactosamine-specific component IID n=1 Tax=Endomicrobium trichonymphae TaxID=1408204 RepID=B1H088_ENDTX|nr:PTS system mannose/fructose/sorbose family transporter subunit IID [Candidatus Endomicrobium trichonymphae]BAG13920.1 PTS mannose/fructose/N-acetylgalactosamine-specific component IID [Candidatus Endomicrobium trichonymphae]
MIKIYFKMFIRAFFIQALWNYERMQNIGFLFILKPFLYKIYLNKDKRKKALLRHTEYFNTHPYMANLIIAIIANLEQKMAKGSSNEKVSDISAVKSAMEGPLAAIGDSFFGGTLRPLAALISVFMLIFLKTSDSWFGAYNVLVPLLFIFLYNVVHIFVRYRLMFVGLIFDRESIVRLSKFDFKLLWKMGNVSKFIISAAALFLYLKVFGFGPAANSILPKITINIVFIYGIVLVLSIFVSKKFSPTFLFYATILTCIA